MEPCLLFRIFEDPKNFCLCGLYLLMLTLLEIKTEKFQYLHIHLFKIIINLLHVNLTTYFVKKNYFPKQKSVLKKDHCVMV